MYLSMLLAVSAVPPPAVEFRDGDRVVLLGGTLVEREQRYGHWEAALHAAHPGKRLTVRNLGWSGDTVLGDSWAGFDPVEKGFDKRAKQVRELKPTVVLLCYGANESFAGPDGVGGFVAGYDKLLESLKPADARVVLVTPLPPLTPALGKPAEERRVGPYATAVKELAGRRGLAVADLYAAARDVPFRPDLTDDGVQLTDAGYRHTAAAFTTALGVTAAPAGDDLRRAVVAKNELFFHRWRPQNETYLFGFRKHEQGRNAAEVAAFDPLVAQAERAVWEAKIPNVNGK